MYSFRNDYSEGAHPKVLKALTETNLEQTQGYGLDPRCQKAADLIRALCATPDADVHFLVGGTQANLLTIEALTKPYEAVIAAHTGHIHVHETGAVEATGRKVLTVPSPDGKLTPAMVESVSELHSNEHQVKPAMAYVSNTTETGTVYSKAELTALRQCCDRHGLLLFLDGARLGSALACSDLTLGDYAALTDAFYIGGTKNGALFGEALVLPRPQADFRWYMKRRGAMLAKGRLLGVQFQAVLKDGLYRALAAHANAQARRLAEGLEALGVLLLAPAESNQVFPILPDGAVEELGRRVEFEVERKMDGGRTCIRFVTAWHTPPEDVDALLELLA